MATNVMTPVTLGKLGRNLMVDVNGLNDDQQEALIRMIEKFIAGCQEHGELDVTGKRWGPELFDEIIDSNFYLMFELMRMERANETA